MHRCGEYGGPDVLRYEDVEQPVPGAGEVRLRVAATSFNPDDGGIRGGYLQGPFPVTLPHTPGIDVAGTVDALGDGVENVVAGDAVGPYAVQLAKRAGAHVIAAASSRSDARVRSAGADEVIDHTATAIGDAVTEPVDVLLNLARIALEELVVLVALVKPGGVVVNTIPTIPTPGDEARNVRAVGVLRPQ